jgi:hypothetical protein
MKAKTLLQGAGIGVLLTLGLLWNLLSRYNLEIYHHQLPANTVIRAVAVDVVLMSLLGWAVVRLFERFDPQGRSVLWIFLAAALASRAIGGLISAEVIDRKGVTPGHVFLAAALAGLLFWALLRRWYPRGVQAFGGLLFLLGFCIFWILPQLAYLSMACQPHDHLSFTRPMAANAQPHARIVWILFDELSYDQLYDHRRSDLAMPNFDRLRAQSVVFSNVQPGGYYTEEVLPALFLGQPVNKIRSSVAGDLYVRSSAQDAWQAFNPESTFFAAAQHTGWTTGLVGSYNPYCRLLQQQLDACWTWLPPYSDHMRPQNSTFGNVMAPLRAALARLVHPHRKNADDSVPQYEPIVDAARAQIQNEDIDLVFAHLPMPHPPGVYHRATGKPGSGGSYIDNLALCDRVLGELEATIAGTRSAGMTTLIITSDHSWRVPLWRNTMGWTWEDEAASGGKFDPRPTLIVRIAGENAPFTVTQPFPLLKEHDLVESLLHGPTDAASLKSWAVAQSSRH